MFFQCEGIMTKKQKTAKLVSYKAYGTRSTYCCEIWYYGKKLKTFTENNEKLVQEQAQNYARNTGFTRWSILLD